MAGKLKHNPGVRLHFLHVIQGRYTYIAHQKGIHARLLKQVIQKGRDRTLALGSRDSDNLIPETLEKHLCLRQYTAPVFIFRPLQDNARAFKYNIVIIHTFLVIRAGMPHRTVLRQGSRILQIRYVQNFICSQPPEDIPGGLSFSAITQKQYAFPLNPVLYLLYHVCSPCKPSVQHFLTSPANSSGTRLFPS